MFVPMVATVVGLLVGASSPNAEPTTPSDTLRSVATIDYISEHPETAEHTWRFGVETRQGLSRAFVERLLQFDDDERDDAVVFRSPMDGLSLDIGSGEIRWTGSGETVVCAVIESNFWSGFRDRVKATGNCAIRCEHETMWLDTGTRLEPRTHETVSLEIHQEDRGPVVRIGPDLRG